MLLGVFGSFLDPPKAAILYYAGRPFGRPGTHRWRLPLQAEPGRNRRPGTSAASRASSHRSHFLPLHSPVHNSGAPFPATPLHEQVHQAIPHHSHLVICGQSQQKLWPLVRAAGGQGEKRTRSETRLTLRRGCEPGWGGGGRGKIKIFFVVKTSQLVHPLVWFLLLI